MVFERGTPAAGTSSMSMRSCSTTARITARSLSFLPPCWPSRRRSSLSADDEMLRRTIPAGATGGGDASLCDEKHAAVCRCAAADWLRTIPPLDVRAGAAPAGSVTDLEAGAASTGGRSSDAASAASADGLEEAASVGATTSSLLLPARRGWGGGR